MEREYLDEGEEREGGRKEGSHPSSSCVIFAILDPRHFKSRHATPALSPNAVGEGANDRETCYTENIGAMPKVDAQQCSVVKQEGRVNI